MNKSNSNKISSSKDLALIIKQTPIIVIKISASWCGPCKDKKFLESYNNIKTSCFENNKIKFIELDIDDNIEILEDKKYYNIDIEFIPTFLISKNGSFIRKFVGGGYLNEINEFIKDNIF